MQTYSLCYIIASTSLALISPAICHDNTLTYAPLHHGLYGLYGGIGKIWKCGGHIKTWKALIIYQKVRARTHFPCIRIPTPLFRSPLLAQVNRICSKTVFFSFPLSLPSIHFLFLNERDLILWSGETVCSSDHHLFTCHVQHLIFKWWVLLKYLSEWTSLTAVSGH